MLQWFKNLFNSYFITCTCVNDIIHVYSEKDMHKAKYCPFCGMTIIKDCHGQNPQIH